MVSDASRSGSVRRSGICVERSLTPWPRAPPPSTSTSSSWVPGSAGRWRPTGWPRPAGRSSCSSAAAPSHRAASPAPPAAWPRTSGSPAEGRHGLFDIWSFDGHRRRGLQRPGRRLADLRQRPAAQGREVVRARATRAAAAATSTGRSPGPTSSRTTTPSSAMIGTAHLPLRRDTPQDRRADARGRRGSRAGRALPPLAISFAPRPAGRRCGRARSDARLRQPPRPAARHLPPCAASATSAATTAPRTPSTTPTSPPRSTRAPTSAYATRSRASGRCGRAAATRSPTSCTPAPTASRPSGSRPDHPLRPAGAGGGHLRHDVPAAAQPRGAARPQRAARHPVLRQRRPARAS